MSHIEDERSLTGARIKKELIELYDSIAPDYDRTRRNCWPRTIAFVNGLDGTQSVLDLGCGNGKDTVLLLKNGHSTVSVDLSANQCLVTKKKIEALLDRDDFFLAKEQTFTVIQADCEDLPLDDERFDACVFMATLHHLPDPLSRKKALAEMKRCLRIGGRALVSVWDLDQPRFKKAYEDQLEEGREDDLGDVMVPWKCSDGREYQRYYHLFLAPDFKQLVIDAGFKSTEFFSADGNHFAVLER